LFDSVRGIYKGLISNDTAAEINDTASLTAFNSNGFTLGPSNIKLAPNYPGFTYVAWQWQAGVGSTSSNTNGSITSTVSVNATAGFSVVTYTGTGANATVGHGLGVAPKMVIVKYRSAARSWIVWQSALAGTEYLLLDGTNANQTAADAWNSTVPTSTVFSLGTSTSTNQSAGAMVAYCWAAIPGYSAFGSYTGNGSTDGTFVYTGFVPKFVLIKKTSGADNWLLYDTARDTYNVAGKYLSPNLSNAEGTDPALDMLSNGFKLRQTGGGINGSGATYIYAAFASNPFKNSTAF
jgi:hypothetical protein